MYRNISLRSVLGHRFIKKGHGAVKRRSHGKTRDFGPFQSRESLALCREAVPMWAEYMGA